MSEPDALFLLRNNFYLGAYQAAINESNVSGLTDAESSERDCFVFRSYIALGSYQLVIDEINESSSTSLQAVKLLAIYFSEPNKKEQVLKTLEEWLADATLAGNTTLLLIAGTIYTHELNYNDALKHLATSKSLEPLALMAQIYLKMDRPDFAEKSLKVMQGIDEDATLTQLTNAWVNLALGGSKIQEAFYIFQELCEKYTWTVGLMNGNATCQMHMGRFEDAETLLLEALNKDSKDANTLANLIVCQLHRGKPYSRYLNQLKTMAPTHVLVQRAAGAEELFEKAITSAA